MLCDAEAQFGLDRRFQNFLRLTYVQTKILQYENKDVSSEKEWNMLFFLNYFIIPE